RACYNKLVAAGIRMHAEPYWDAIKVAPDGTKTGYSATYCRDPFGNVFEIMEIHADPTINPV
ncbi:MAG: VOC family protein, partial [Novosphingobium sp.]